MTLKPCAQADKVSESQTTMKWKMSKNISVQEGQLKRTPGCDMQATDNNTRAGACPTAGERMAQNAAASESAEKKPNGGCKRTEDDQEQSKM